MIPTTSAARSAALGQLTYDLKMVYFWNCANVKRPDGRQFNPKRYNQQLAEAIRAGKQLEFARMLIWRTQRYGDVIGPPCGFLVLAVARAHRVYSVEALVVNVTTGYHELFDDGDHVQAHDRLLCADRGEYDWFREWETPQTP